MIPSTYNSLPRQEKAFIIASIQVKTEDEKKENAKVNKTKPKGKKGK